MAWIIGSLFRHLLSGSASRKTSFRKAKRESACRLTVERLEDRAVPAAFSIADAVAIEGGAAYRFTDSFVAPDGYGLAASRAVQVGPDGNVYVASLDTDSVKVFEGGTGRYLRDLTTPGGELNTPWGMTFGPDGRLYVCGSITNPVVRFDIGTGAYDVFVTANNSGGLEGSHGLTFGPDGNLYVSTRVPNAVPATTDTVKRYDGVTGAYLGDFVSAGSGGLDRPQGIAFGPDGNLYVPSAETKEIKRYSGTTGAYIGNFVSAGSGGLSRPAQLTFRGDGYLYVSDQDLPKVFRYSAATGAFVDVFATSPVSIGAIGLAFAPTGELYVSQGVPTMGTGSLVSRFAPSSTAAFSISLNASSASPVSVSFGTADATALAGSDYTAASGSVDFAPGETTRTVLVQSVDNAVGEPTETFTVSLANAVGATITDGQSVGTILDNETPLLTINDVSIAEGNSGTKVLTFTVTLSAASNQTVTVNYATANGTATTSNNDYTAASGTLTFAPGQTTKTITVTIKGDKKNEGNETFFVNLSGAVNAVLADSQGLGTILNDD